MSSGHEVMLAYEWLIAVLGGDSTLASEAPGGVWRSLAPPGVSTPFVIVSYHTGVDVTNMNGFRLLADLTFQVKAVGPASNTATLALAAERIDILIGRTSGSVTGGAILSCVRTNPLQLDEEVNGELWTNAGGFYNLLVEQTS